MTPKILTNAVVQTDRHKRRKEKAKTAQARFMLNQPSDVTGLGQQYNILMLNRFGKTQKVEHRLIRHDSQ